MGQSLSAVFVHIIFGTKNRQPLIDDFIRQRLWTYLGGICSQLKCFPIQIGGTEDHVHLLTYLSRDICIKDFVGKIKAGSSKWIKTISPCYSSFAWQSGYGAFSVNPINKDELIHYIINQAEHHKKMDFSTELRKLLHKCNIQYDEKYLFDD